MPPAWSCPMLGHPRLHRPSVSMALVSVHDSMALMGPLSFLIFLTSPLNHFSLSTRSHLHATPASAALAPICASLDRLGCHLGGRSAACACRGCYTLPHSNWLPLRLTRLSAVTPPTTSLNAPLELMPSSPLSWTPMLGFPSIRCTQASWVANPTMCLTCKRASLHEPSFARLHRFNSICIFSPDNNSPSRGKGETSQQRVRAVTQECMGSENVEDNGLD